ncbi:MAG: T6SS effector amidase Tae4 family protein [Sphingobium sp.]|uniref:T6SS effector amidase Tae4 family protein n=1 Tax=Sphingobium sp. TaxID=1912891 RepID=UPI0029AF1F27|nr:T6SS effector amidase Tae4 family protein [Sphingobium sp.]MDX3911714.1 T6SS effector amidase Tae4 family protein [Sphingobium sp.]
MAINFQDLWDAYPTMKQEPLFNKMGGGWPALIGDKRYENTCTIRLSVAMHAIGSPPPADLVAADGKMKDGAGRGICIRVPTANKWLQGLLGNETWGMTKIPGTDLKPPLPDWTGILLYLVPGGIDAAGHVDLWNKGDCRVDCHVDYARDATDLKLWRL